MKFNWWSENHVTQRCINVKTYYDFHFKNDCIFSVSTEIASSTPASLGLLTWRDYQAGFNGHVSRIKRTRSYSIILSFLWGREEPPGVARRASIVWLENWNERSTFALEFYGGFVALGTF